MSWMPAFTDKLAHPVPIVSLLKSKQKKKIPVKSLVDPFINIIFGGIVYVFMCIDYRGSGYAYYTKIEPQWAKVVA
ncbi:3555_t:CDS:2, partial [Cetraspora pellucida]